VKFITEIKNEDVKWAQPVSIKRVSIEASAPGEDTAVYGAGCLAVRNLIRE
jgi:hypothetical protein